MCHPAVMIGFSALQAGAQYMGEKAQAEATYKYQLEKRYATEATAADAARHQYQGLAARTEQVRAAATQDVNNQLGAYLQAQSRLKVAAAAGGVSGGSVEEAGQSFARKYIDSRVSRLMNLTWEENQIFANIRGVEAQQRGRHEGAGFGPVAMPSPLGAAAEAVSGFFRAANMFPNHPMFAGMVG